jgi:hypothetical protein
VLSVQLSKDFSIAKAIELSKTYVSFLKINSFINIEDKASDASAKVIKQ